MNAFNRFIMFVLALLLIAVPVLLLLIAFGVFSADAINAVTGYRSTVRGLTGLVSNFNFAQETRVIIGIVGALVALIAGYLLLRELTFGRPVAKKALVDDTPGRETAITATAVRHLAEGAAREVGAESPSCSLASNDGRYDVACEIRVPKSRNFAETAAQTRENVRRVLGEQHVPLNNVEVTVQGSTASQG
ncbi:MAG: alkaline shock response membrane anchor protein AmaP [Actinomycetota bacterium]|nr:alkaline shock response membrane anchor protein AmaP [Actinomycetota bacterium]